MSINFASGDGERPSVSVVIPTLNEAGSLPWVLDALPAWVSEVILVDGLSTDGTEQVAREMRPEIVVVHQLVPGKGAALRAGFAATTGEIVVMIDADGSTDPREMGRFVDALVDGGDFVKGSRHINSGGSADFTRARSLGNRVFVLLANLLHGSRFTDLCYGYCAFWRRHLDVLALTATGSRSKPSSRSTRSGAASGSARSPASSLNGVRAVPSSVRRGTARACYARSLASAPAAR